MKKIIFLSMALIGLSIGLPSCSSSDYDANPSVNNSNIKNPLRGDFTAKINGVVYIADEKVVTDTTINNHRMISITGTAFSPEKDPEKFQNIAFTISDYKGPRAYYVDAGDATGLYYVQDHNYSELYTSSFSDTLATVSFTQDGSKWEGTFNMKVISQDNDTVNITDGYFSIPK